MFKSLNEFENKCTADENHKNQRRKRRNETNDKTFKELKNKIKKQMN